MRRLIIALAALALCVPIFAAAAPVTWIIPTGGEV